MITHTHKKRFYMSIPKKVNGKRKQEMFGTIELYDGLDLKRTASFTYRARRREIMQQ